MEWNVSIGTYLTVELKAGLLACVRTHVILPGPRRTPDLKDCRGGAASGVILILTDVVNYAVGLTTAALAVEEGKAKSSYSTVVHSQQP